MLFMGICVCALGGFVLFVFLLCDTAIPFLLCAEKSWTPHTYTPPCLVINTQAAGCPPAVLVENDPQGCNSRFGYCRNAKTLFCSCKWGGSVLEEALHTKGKPIESHAMPCVFSPLFIYLDFMLSYSRASERVRSLYRYIYCVSMSVYIHTNREGEKKQRAMQIPCIQ